MTKEERVRIYVSYDGLRYCPNGVALKVMGHVEAAQVAHRVARPAPLFPSHSEQY
jgi:hypothetical protein